METHLIEQWLQPLADDAGGPDLEYDPAFLELAQTSIGRPETQFSLAEPPSWDRARELSSDLFDRTRDLRVAMMWGRAVINLEGLQGLPAALFMLHGLLDRFWGEVHPRPDGGDTFARLSILGSLDSLDGLVGDVRQAQLGMDRSLGGIRVRDVEVALERLPARAKDSPLSCAHIEGILGDHPELAQRIRESVSSSLGALKSLQGLMNERFGTDNAVDTKNLRGMLTAVASLLPSGSVGAEHDSDETDALGTNAARNPGSGVLTINSRQDAVRAINLICAYLDHSEPTNPAQLLLRRAERLIDKDFLQLVRELAPEAVNEVARIMGVEP